MIEIVQRVNRMLNSTASSLQTLLLLIVRLYWGWQFVQTGWGKLSGLDKVGAYFTQLGIPAPGPTALFISLLEFVGGILLAFGLASRFISLLLACDMIVAFIIADREALFSIFSDPDKFYAAAPYTFLFASLLILTFGPGKLCLDAILAKRLQSRPHASAIAAVEC
jgi:putative oxidoreductase